MERADDLRSDGILDDMEDTYLESQLTLRKAGQNEFKKNRHFYPLLVQFGLEALSLRPMLVKSRLDFPNSATSGAVSAGITVIRSAARTPYNSPQSRSTHSRNCEFPDSQKLRPVVPMCTVLELFAMDSDSPSVFS